MIISHLVGGLGNQLFQYAYGFAMAQEQRTSFKLDTSHYTDDPLRSYRLSHFQISAHIATAHEIERIMQMPDRWNNRILQRLFPRRPHVIDYVDLPFREKYLDVPRDAYLKGYWQSEKFFAAHRNALLNQFQLKSALSDASKSIAQEITTSHAVSLHVRRGDYVQNAHTNTYHGVCSMQYYASAAEHIAQRVNDPVFFIFSDDPQWVKENMKLNYAMRIIDTQPAAEDYEDLHLMSLCRHHIIANSSFSWWGAWLNTHAEKIVIAPKQWLAREEDNRKTSDLVPEQWLRM